MRKVAVSVLTLALIAAAAAGVGVAASARTGWTTNPPALRTPPATTRVVCRRDTKRARIGGRIRCLRVGQPCDPRFNTTKPSYRRYGFFCSSRASNEPATLFRIAQPGTAPSECAGIGPTPASTPPGLQNEWVGDSPFWLGPYLRRDPGTSVWRYTTNLPLKGSDGWAVKFVWLLARTITNPVRLSITDLASGRPLSITIVGTYTERSAAPLLDPGRPSHPDVPDKPSTHEWGSYVVFPRASCYRLDAQWPQGFWSLVFSFGR